jgi:type IX secretion system PorP/SprF family membrane protein
MKKITIITGLILFGNLAIGQQLGQFSQYLNNQFILNPAAAGEHNYFDIDLSFRQQWVGFDNGPQNYYLSGHTKLGKTAEAPFVNSSLRPSHESSAITEVSGGDGKTRKIQHGVGGTVAADNYGAFRKLNFSGSYALIIPVAKKAFWSFGANVGLTNLGFDQNSISLANSSDNVYDQFASGSQRRNLLDLNLGTYFYSDKFYIGYSTNQLLQNKIYFGGTPLDGKLNVHHFLSAGYNIEMSDKWTVTPSFLVKYMNPAPVSFDLSTKVTFDKKYFAGVSYRQGDAIIAMVGANINDLIKIGYSYDYTTSEIGNYSTGGHEVMLGVMLNRKQK